MADRAALCPLRTAVVVTGLLAQLATALSGVLPWAALPFGGVLLVLATRAGLAARGRAATRLHRLATVLAAGLALAVLPRVVTAAGPQDVRTSLGLLLVGVQLVHGLTWQHRRDLQTGLLGAIGLLVLAASYAPDVVAGLPLVAGLAGAVWSGLVAVRLAQLEGADAVAVPEGRVRRTTSLAGPVALAGVLGLVAYLLVPVPAVGVAGRGPAGHRADGTAVWSSSRLDLRVRGALSDRPVAVVPSGSPRLWRGQVYETYDGSSWQATRTPPVPVAGPPYAVATGDGPTRTDDVRLATPGTVLFAPGPVLEVDATGAGVLRVDVDSGVTTTSPVSAYRVTSARQAPAADADDPRWRLLPQALPGRVVELALSLTDGTADRAAAVGAVEEWLRAHATYRLDSPVPRAGEDAVDRFLFVDRTGFCEQFAAAETVLLRAAGIPARLVTGLAYGVDAGPVRTYTERHRHAWVEVADPELGWVVSDPTAGATLAEDGAGVRARVASVAGGLLSRADDLPGGRPVLAGLLLLAAALGAGLVRRRRPLRPGDPEPGPPAGPALAAFLRFDARLGPHRRQPAESLGDLRARLPLAPATDEALGVVEDECYAAVPPPGAPAAAEVLDGAAP
jgi:protein-glutamine gamma-glutamyltransferase